MKASVDHAIRLLVQAHAFPDMGPAYKHTPDMDGAPLVLLALQCVADSGKVVQVAEQDDGGIAWVFTPQGLSALQMQHCLRKPQLALRFRELDDRGKWTRYELIRRLEELGLILSPWK